MICNLGNPMSLRHPVEMQSTKRERKTETCCIIHLQSPQVHLSNSVSDSRTCSLSLFLALPVALAPSCYLSETSLSLFPSPFLLSLALFLSLALSLSLSPVSLALPSLFLSLFLPCSRDLLSAEPTFNHHTYISLSRIYFSSLSLFLP